MLKKNNADPDESSEPQTEQRRQFKVRSCTVRMNSAFTDLFFLFFMCNLVDPPDVPGISIICLPEAPIYPVLPICLVK